MARRARARAARAALVAAAVVGVAACGGGEPSALEEAGDLDRIRSGELSLRVLTSAGTAGGGAEARTGFEMEGPFALPEEPGTLPVADLAYTRVAGGERATVRVVSDGDDAFVAVGDRHYRLPGDRLDVLRAPGRDRSGAGGRLHLDEWLVDPMVTDAVVDGEPVRRATGTARAARTLADLLALVRWAGAPGAAAAGSGGAGGVGDGDGDEADLLESMDRAVTSSTAEILTGRDDNLLRALHVELAFATQAPAHVREALGGLGGAHLEVDLRVRRPNRPVEVQAPRDARPYSELAEAAGRAPDSGR